MALDPIIRDQLTLPVICAPMFLVTGPDLVREACKAGVIGGLPRANARTLEEFEAWMKAIREALDAHKAENPGARIAPLAVNLNTRLPADELKANLDIMRRYGADIVISAAGDPTQLVAQVHDWGGKVFHDVTSIRFAEKAIAGGADGLTCIGAGGGGHSGTISHLALIPQVRAIFDGTIILAGAVSTGAVVRAAEILGADLAYMGTRFIATRESDAPAAYKALLVSETSADLLYTPKVAGVAANWMVESIRQNGLDPLALPEPLGKGMRHDHLPDDVRPWKTLWSAGQGIDLIKDVPSVAELVARLRAEYVAACEAPSYAEAARLADRALEAAGA
ncbi:nitronate monooxygenase [Caulobacter sp. SLTY]|uniref:NAD(P)H-dependent flavin oxidoreductase n=1 Tax=Caulobacter sp. SLTY TaxID=2683262 RepID=UPI0014127FA6|nr:nitronate monooxygenase [Caulobacter sp. SLTY]NBB16494.1 nitronate monooxygenase [Caulobacter sp. SLTY]